jgi:hypothetical protein
MDIATQTRDYSFNLNSRLPQEVLCHVFRQYFADLRYWFLYHHGYGRFYDGIRTLSCVCRHWYTLIVDTVELFAWVYIDHKTRRERLETLLAMSKDSDLTVYISVHENLGAPGLMEILRPHVGRVRSFVISMELGALGTLFSGTGPAPVRLKVLDVQSRPGRSVIAILPVSLPCLRSLTLHGEMDWTHRRWHEGLRCLSLVSFDSRSAGQDGVSLLRRLVDFLRGMPNLRKLELKHINKTTIINRAATQPVHLAHLTDLRLSLPTEWCVTICRNLSWGGGRIFIPGASFTNLGAASVKLLERLALALNPLLLTSDARRSLHRLTLASIGGIIEVELTSDTITFADADEPLNRQERELYHGLFLGMYGDLSLTTPPHVAALRSMWMGISLHSLTLIGNENAFSPEGLQAAFDGLGQVDNVEIVQIACPVLLSTLSADPLVLPALSRLWIRRSDHTEHTEQEWLEVVNQLVDTFGSGKRPRLRLELLRLDELPLAPVSAEVIAQLEGCAERVLLRSSLGRRNPDFEACENGRMHLF